MLELLREYEWFVDPTILNSRHRSSRSECAILPRAQGSLG